MAGMFKNKCKSKEEVKSNHTLVCVGSGGGNETFFKFKTLLENSHHCLGGLEWLVPVNYFLQQKLLE